MDITRLLNDCHAHKGFVYERSWLAHAGVFVRLRPRRRSWPICSGCDEPGPTYDTATTPRLFEFLPLWIYKVFIEYCMRRVDCPRCGVTVEKVPWADGKEQSTHAYKLFLARWARRLSWSEVAEVFHTNWGVVYRAVEWVVAYGLAHRSLDGIQSIGVDEIAVWKGQSYLTVVYQIDQGMRRLLWVGAERTEETLRGFFRLFGEARSMALAFIASDMWQPYLTVIAEFAKKAVHVLDRFHIVAKLNKAVDDVRAHEARELARQGYEPVLKHTRWCFLKRRERQTPSQRQRLRDVLAYDLRSVRAFLLKEAFEVFWTYTSPTWAGWFLDRWTRRALLSRLEPMRKFARTLRSHRDLILNWFRASKEISAAAVEGMNTNAKLAIRKARGFRTYAVLETALYHELAHLPEPPIPTHGFC